MARLLSVNVGLPRDIPWQSKTVHTGIWKTPVQGRRMVRRLNIDGDGQGCRQSNLVSASFFLACRGDPWVCPECGSWVCGASSSDDGLRRVRARRKRMAAKIEVARRVPSFRECAEAYIAAHAAEWTNAKHVGQWAATLATYAYPIFGDLPVSAVDTGLVMRVLEPHWATKRESMSRVRGRIESVLGWAAVRGYREGDNPARWRGHLANLLARPAKKVQGEHHNALPYAALPAFMAELRAKDGMPARALEFLILTAARRDEVRLAQWAEIDLAGRVWTIPGERMKIGREHRVPLSEPATTLLQALPRRGPYLFPGRGSALAQNTMLHLLKVQLGRAGEATVHGFRSCFVDWATEQTNFPSEVREMALAHVVGDKVEAAYRRGDLFEKRAAR
jgi:integrase